MESLDVISRRNVARLFAEAKRAKRAPEGAPTCLDTFEDITATIAALPPGVRGDALGILHGHLTATRDELQALHDLQ